MTMPPPPASDEFIEPFEVGEIVVTSLEALLSAAALNLGDVMSDGKRLLSPNPQQAYLALVSASALVVELSPLMEPSIFEHYQAALLGLCERFSNAFPDLPVNAPGSPGAVAQILKQTTGG